MSFTKEFPIVMREVEKKVKEMENLKKKREAQARSYTTAKDPARTLEDDFEDSDYITDAELLSAAELCASGHCLPSFLQDITDICQKTF
ncbi:hypothetical protein DPMN_119419 [Dreissena polymorpha]|uniref:Uncharacterized protein n=1 Tax=Dreissena polymorpha TaxID=45954 RepID=A0A9D4JR88_DREPO|nr:hypothetical protein DPMN_119419 [Dreissena polymorpha]